MNQPETAFLEPMPTTSDGRRRADGPTWRLRWFTPVCEVELCGHATLAAAHHLLVDLGVEAGAAALRHPLGHPHRPRPAVTAGSSSTSRSTRPVETEAPDGLLEALRHRQRRHRGPGPLRLAGRGAVGRRRAGARPDMTALAAARRGRPGRHRHRRRRRASTTWCPASSPRPPASPRTRSPARPTPRSPRSGPSGSRPPTSSPTRRRPGAASIKVSLRDDRVLLGGQAVTVFRGSFEDDLLQALYSRRAVDVPA